MRYPESDTLCVNPACRTRYHRALLSCPMCDTPTPKHLPARQQGIKAILLACVALGVLSTVVWIAPLLIFRGAAKNDAVEMTAEQYSRVQKGMAYKDVVAIVGSPGRLAQHLTLQDSEITTYSWKNGNALGGASISFINGAVESKAWLAP